MMDQPRNNALRESWRTNKIIRISMRKRTTTSLRWKRNLRKSTRMKLEVMEEQLQVTRKKLQMGVR
jgi:hypothetical protein